jgi:phenylalanine-4-hydroxylase
MGEALAVQSHRPPARLAKAPRADFTIDQDFPSYTAAEHAIWRMLFHRQERLLRHRACDEFLAGWASLRMVSPIFGGSTRS